METKSTAKSKLELYAELLELERAKREKAREKFHTFLDYKSPTYQRQWFHTRIADKCQALYDGTLGKNRLMIFVPPQHGKEISDKTPVPTPNGWKKHGDLVAGDIVFGRNGEQVRVIATNEKVRSEYLVKFSDSTEIECHGNHEWVVYDRSLKRERQIETKQMARTKLYSGEVGHRGCHYRYKIDAGKVIQYDDREVLIDPYTLGAWLGDGCSTWAKIHIGNNDTEIIDAIPYETKEGSGNTTRVFYIHGISHKFREYYLYDNKHIPEDYIYNSVKVRTELIAGIIDTDGSVYQKNGRVTISNSNGKIICGCITILKSLGQNVSVCQIEPAMSSSGIQGKETIYQISFNPTIYFPTKVKRKGINRIITPRSRAIISVERKEGLGFGNCIQVEGGVYLVGENFIPTHNSEIVSRSFPAWVLGNNPGAKIVGASYSADLAQQFSRAIQRTMDDDAYLYLFKETRLNGQDGESARGYIRNADFFETIGKGGFYKAVGVGGGLTGTAVDIGIIDDPVKDAMEAYSETYRDRVWNWYTDVFLTRLHNDSKQLLIMTRWHDDDLAGRILKSEADKWEVLTIPAIKENDDDQEDPRKIGEALWEARHSADKLNEMRSRSPRTYNSLYQQHPTIEGGNIVKNDWFKRVSFKDFSTFRNSSDSPVDFFLDTAYTENTKNDPTGIIATTKIGNTIYILNARKVNMTFPDLIRFIPRWCEDNGYDESSRIMIEPKANGISVIDQLRENTQLNVMRTPTPKEGKETRLYSASPAIEAGRVALVEGPWIDEFIDEVCGFPAKAHDEYVDVLVYAINHYHGARITEDEDYEQLEAILY